MGTTQTQSGWCCSPLHPTFQQSPSTAILQHFPPLLIKNGQKTKEVRMGVEITMEEDKERPSSDRGMCMGAYSWDVLSSHCLHSGSGTAWGYSTAPQGLPCPQGPQSLQGTHKDPKVSPRSPGQGCHTPQCHPRSSKEQQLHTPSSSFPPHPYIRTTQLSHLQ